MSHCGARASRRLQLNAEKTEAIWFGSRENLKKLTNCSLRVGSETIQPSTFVRDLGASISRRRTHNETACVKGCRCVFLPSASTTSDSPSRRHGSHGSSACACTHHLQTGLQLSVSWRATVHSQHILQRVQNAAGRLIFRQRDHVSDSLIELHWLPIHWRIQYKLNVLMHMESSPGGVLTICRPSSSQSLHHIHGFVRRRALRQSSLHRDYARSLASVPSATPAQRRGTHFLATSVRVQLIHRHLKRCSAQILSFSSSF